MTDSEGFVERIRGSQVENEKPIQGIKIFILPSPDSDPKMLKFQFSASKFDKEKLSLDLKFENPDHVSFNEVREKLVIEFF